MKKYIFTLLFSLFTSVIHSQISSFTNVTLSDSAFITILTCGPGGDLYSLFGHSAIRVKDSKNSVDLVFNYGTFDFSAPNFYTKFANGELDYCLSAYPYRYFPLGYIEENRWIDEQVLDIDNQSINILFKALIINSKESNRYYRYDFFFDNCATRIRDILVNNIPSLVQPKDSLSNAITFREQMNIYLRTHPWTHLGLNLALGAKCDMRMSNWSFTFIPDNLRQFVANSCIEHNDSNETVTSLIRSQERIIESTESMGSLNIFNPILLIFILLLLSLLSFYFSINIAATRIIDGLLFFAVGVAGIIIYFLSFFSSHLICSSNYNTLVISPLFLIFLLPSNHVWVIRLKSYLSILILFLLFVFFLIAISKLQYFTFETYLIAILLSTRLLPRVTFLTIYFNKLKKPL